MSLEDSNFCGMLSRALLTKMNAPDEGSVLYQLSKTVCYG